MMTRGDPGADLQGTVPPCRPGEAWVPLGLLVFRCVLPVATPFYLDWIVIFCIYWTACCFLPGRRWTENLTAAAAMLMFGVYLWRTLPTLLDTLRFCL